VLLARKAAPPLLDVIRDTGQRVGILVENDLQDIEAMAQACVAINLFER
jgi:hypothetical protein